MNHGVHHIYYNYNIYYIHSFMKHYIYTMLYDGYMDIKISWDIIASTSRYVSNHHVHRAPCQGKTRMQT